MNKNYVLLGIGAIGLFLLSRQYSRQTGIPHNQIFDIRDDMTSGDVVTETYKPVEYNNYKNEELVKAQIPVPINTGEPFAVGTVLNIIDSSGRHVTFTVDSWKDNGVYGDRYYYAGRVGNNATSTSSANIIGVA